jgi:hypothetical protein
MLYTWKCYKEIPYLSEINKNIIFSFTKLENRKTEQVLSEGLVPVGGGSM